MAWRHFTWIEGPYRLSIMQCPDGSNLDRDLVELRDQGVNVLVSVLEPDEAAGLGLGDEASVCARHGIEFLSFPIRDHEAPTSAENAIRFARQLAAKLESGKGAVIHCFAGHGRSATMALVTLRLLGWPLDDAVQRLSRARGFPVPETPQQLQWLANLPPTLLRSE